MVDVPLTAVTEESMVVPDSLMNFVPFQKTGIPGVEKKNFSPLNPAVSLMLEGKVEPDKIFSSESYGREFGFVVPEDTLVCRIPPDLTMNGYTV